MAESWKNMTTKKVLFLEAATCYCIKLIMKRDPFLQVVKYRLRTPKLNLKQRQEN